MAKSKLFLSKKIEIPRWRILQSTPENEGGVKILSDQKNNATLTLKTFSN